MANPHKKGKAKLARRMAEFEKGCTSREQKVQMRWGTGGYHAPGSQNSHK